MTFDLIQAWMDLKAQLPTLAVEGIGLKYVYPIFLGLIVLEYVNAKHLYDLKESLSGFIIGVGATLIRVVTNVFEISLYMFLF